MRHDIGLSLLILSIAAMIYGLYRWQNHRRRERARIWGSPHSRR